MRKRAIIFDLDNTIYPVQSIGEELFAPLFDLLFSQENIGDKKKIREDIMRRPFQLVARDHHFSDELTEKGIALLKDLTYDTGIKPFDDYHFTKSLNIEKFLVTTGFLKLQQSKIKGMQLEKDFIEVHIIDPMTSTLTKKDVFADIIQRHQYVKDEVLVVGDDLHSEIKAAKELNIDAILYDKHNFYTHVNDVPRITTFKALNAFLESN
jgi:putative hydrolase of the HAD superfamily